MILFANIDVFNNCQGAWNFNTMIAAPLHQQPKLYIVNAVVDDTSGVGKRISIYKIQLHLLIAFYVYPVPGIRLQHNQPE